MIEEIRKLYYKETIGSEHEAVEKFVFMQNDIFLDIFNQLPVFNILNLLHIQYSMENDDGFYIEEKRVESINGKQPWYALAEYSPYYLIKFITGETICMDYPVIKNGEENMWERMPIIKEKNIYLFLNDFANEKNIDILKENQGKTLFLDLRGNRGGSVKQMIKFLELFVKGDLFFFLNKKMKYKIMAKKANTLKFEKIILLLDKNTASSAEIFADTLKEAKNCLLIGEQTFGKWVAQEMIQCHDKYIKIPRFKYIPFNNTEKKDLEGIKPDWPAGEDEVKKILAQYRIVY